MTRQRIRFYAPLILVAVVAIALAVGTALTGDSHPTPPAPKPAPLREQQVGDYSTCILQGNRAVWCYQRASRNITRTPLPAASTPPNTAKALHRNPDAGTPSTAPPVPADLRGGQRQRVTAYCATGNRTASGVWPQPGMAATLDRSIPFGTVLDVAGLGRYTVTDRIGHGSDVDLYLGSGADCERRASRFGVQRLVVRGVR